MEHKSKDIEVLKVKAKMYNRMYKSEYLDLREKHGNKLTTRERGEDKNLLINSISFGIFLLFEANYFVESLVNTMKELQVGNTIIDNNGTFEHMKLLLLMKDRLKKVHSFDIER